MSRTAREKIHGPRNRQPGDPTSRSPEDAWRYLVDVWSRRTITFDERASGSVRMPYRYSTRMPALIEPLATVLAELESTTVPTMWTVEKEHLRARVLLDEVRPGHRGLIETRDEWELGRALIEVWAGAAGLAFCLDVLTHAPVFVRASEGGEDDDYVMRMAFVPPDEEGQAFRLDAGVWNEVDPQWWALREWISQRSDDDFARDREVAVAALAARSGPDRWALNARCRIAFAFSRDPSLGHQVAAPLIARGIPAVASNAEHGPNPVDAVVFLYPSLPDASSVSALVDRVFRPDWNMPPGNLSFDVVDAYGADAAPLLERFLAVKRAPSLTKTERAALKLAQTPAKAPKGAKAKPEKKTA